MDVEQNEYEINVSVLLKKEGQRLFSLPQKLPGKGMKEDGPKGGYLKGLTGGPIKTSQKKGIRIRMVYKATGKEEREGGKGWNIPLDIGPQT